MDVWWRRRHPARLDPVPALDHGLVPVSIARGQSGDRRGLPPSKIRDTALGTLRWGHCVGDTVSPPPVVAPPLTMPDVLCRWGLGSAQAAGLGLTAFAFGAGSFFAVITYVSLFQTLSTPAGTAAGAPALFLVIAPLSIAALALAAMNAGTPSHGRHCRSNSFTPPPLSRDKSKLGMGPRTKSERGMECPIRLTSGGGRHAVGPPHSPGLASAGSLGSAAGQPAAPRFGGPSQVWALHSSCVDTRCTGISDVLEGVLQARLGCPCFQCTGRAWLASSWGPGGGRLCSGRRCSCCCCSFGPDQSSWPSRMSSAHVRRRRPQPPPPACSPLPHRVSLLSPGRWMDELLI